MLYLIQLVRDFAGSLEVTNALLYLFFILFILTIYLTVIITKKIISGFKVSKLFVSNVNKPLSGHITAPLKIWAFNSSFELLRVYSGIVKCSQSLGISTDKIKQHALSGEPYKGYYFSFLDSDTFIKPIN